MRPASRMQRDRRLVDATLRRFLPRPGSVPLTVRRAMAYSLFPGGKRLRPILAIIACRALGGRVADVLPAGAAIEMIHTYSLIHDDLPALDNDDLRRGRATSHRVFGEAMAILAGDALLTHAFEIAASHPAGERDAARKVRAIRLLARAAGVTGMIGGQVMDLEAEGRPYTYGTLLRIHRGKTGSLISAAAQIGGIMAGGRPDDLRALSVYGDHVGLAFQIIDDILDREGSTDRLGKTTGKDARARKATYPALLGIEESRRRARAAARRAERAIARLGRRGRPLAGLARFIVDRVS
ncbi:MAG: polyprenyl synthetase family protein [Acidobacteriota bacterium]